MDQAPLVMDDIEAGEAFIRRLHDYAPVKAAWWMRKAERGYRNLYVAIDVHNESDVDIAYGEVLRITRDMKDHYVDPFRVKVVSTNDPVAKAVMDVYHRFPGRIPYRFDGPGLVGGVDVAEVIIYPELPAKP